MCTACLESAHPQAPLALGAFSRANDGYGFRVGLLTAPLSLARTPLRLTLQTWELGLSTAAEAARIGIALLGSDEPAPDFARRSPPAPPDYTGNGQPAEAPDIEAEVVLVAEAADEGAEDGAGPELHVDPPWAGYDQMTAAAIRDRLVAATPTEAAAVELYEATKKSRSSVLEAAERALRR